MTPAVLLIGVVLAAGGKPVTLGADAWTTASPASVLAAYGPMRGLAQTLEASPNAILVIRHAGGETDGTRAAALRAALVALGIPSTRLRLEPAAAPAGSLILELSSPGFVKKPE